MSEPLLLKLIQLFAIASRFHSERGRVEKIIRHFLQVQLSIGQPERYLQVFDEYHAQNLKTGTTRGGNEDNFSVRESSRMVLLCSQLNEELNQGQKLNIIIILISLLESEANPLKPQELEFLHSVGEVFNIPDSEFHQIIHFCRKKKGQDPDFKNVLIISSNPERKPKFGKHLLIGNLTGYIAIMKLEKSGSFHVKFSGSENVSLNGVLMLENEVYDFSAGDLIKSNNGFPIYYSDILSRFMEDRQENQIIFDVKGLEYQFPNGKKGLHTLDFSETSGKMVGLMGASGAGKSTLLEVLNGNLRPSAGHIKINGLDLQADKKKLEGVIGYVPQDDLLIEDITVFQNLFYAAKLSFADKSKEELKALVQKTVNDLGLSEISRLRVGSPMEKIISGGERKRVNIGLELLRAPGILFLDEPTSGLSSRDSQSIIELLKELSLQGKLVFVVIHQPSSDIFKMFDRLLIMDTGGYPIYYGNPIEAIVYFKGKTNQLNKEHAYCYECGHVNPETIFDLIEARRVTEFGKYTRERKIQPQEWYEEFRKNFSAQKLEVVSGVSIQAIRAADWLRQFNVFIKRDLLSKLNNKQYMAINLLQAPLLAFLLAYINRYYNIDKLSGSQYSFAENDNIPVFIFISIIVCLFLGLTVSAEEIFHDRKILKREKFLNLSRSSYLLSKVLILFSLSAFQTIAFWFISCLILEINEFSWIQLGLLFSASAFANMLGLNISSAFNQAVTIYILIPILLIPQLVLGGIVIQFNKINPDLKDNTNVPIISEIMASRWAYEGIMISFFKDNQYNKALFETNFSKHSADNRYIYVFPELEAKLQYAMEYSNSGLFKHKEKIASDFEVLRNELNLENALHPALTFDRVADLKPGCDGKTMQAAMDYISRLRLYYSGLSKNASDKESDLIGEMEKSEGGNKGLNNLRLASHNRSIERYLKNTDDEKKIIETGGRIVQMADPVFRAPDGNHIFSRAHFFSPFKYLLDVRMDTPVFNIIVLWLMTGFLYILLWFDGLKKLIDFLSSGKGSRN